MIGRSPAPWCSNGRGCSNGATANRSSEGEFPAAEVSGGGPEEEAASAGRANSVAEGAESAGRADSVAGVGSGGASDVGSSLVSIGSASWVSCGLKKNDER